MIKRLLLFSTILLLLACQGKQSPMEEDNAVYYWRTDLRLDSTERAFLKQYHIDKVYCRYFDVVMNDSLGPMPNATLTFNDTLPWGIEIIPTVFIVENCMHQKPEGLAKKLVDRIVQMNETNDIMGVKEIQIDCDYTARSRMFYYQFLEEVRKEAKEHGMRIWRIRTCPLPLPILSSSGIVSSMGWISSMSLPQRRSSRSRMPWRRNVRN